MIELNFSNVEDLVFFDSELQKILFRHFSLFEQWRLGKRIPYLRELGRQAILDLLNALNDEDVVVMETYFGDRIRVERLNYGIARSYRIPLSEACETLCGVEGLNYFDTWRDETHLYISFWR
jgi:hypothetical protein